MGHGNSKSSVRGLASYLTSQKWRDKKDEDDSCYGNKKGLRQTDKVLKIRLHSLKRKS